MNEEKPRERLFQANFRKNLVAGFLTIIPLVVVWLVFDFFLEALSSAGRRRRHGTMTPSRERPCCARAGRLAQR